MPQSGVGGILARSPFPSFYRCLPAIAATIIEIAIASASACLSHTITDSIPLLVRAFGDSELAISQRASHPRNIYIQKTDRFLVEAVG